MTGVEGMGKRDGPLEWLGAGEEEAEEEGRGKSRRHSGVVESWE